MEQEEGNNSAEDDGKPASGSKQKILSRMASPNKLMSSLLASGRRQMEGAGTILHHDAVAVTKAATAQPKLAFSRVPEMSTGKSVETDVILCVASQLRLMWSSAWQ